jgi:hypothetical protein
MAGLSVLCYVRVVVSSADGVRDQDLFRVLKEAFTEASWSTLCTFFTMSPPDGKSIDWLTLVICFFSLWSVGLLISHLYTVASRRT